MSHSKKETCFIHFMDGSSMSFQFDAPSEDTLSVASQIHNVIDNNIMRLEVDNKLVFIPISNIRTIEITPAPAKLPPQVLKGARTVS